MTPTNTTDRFAQAVAFFHEHAGYSYSADEGPEAGRSRCARELAEAEREGASAGLTFRWIEDDECAGESGPLWCCVARDSLGITCASLCGIDLGPSGHPDSAPYARVVRAELAMEALEHAERPADAIPCDQDGDGFTPAD